MNSSVMKQYAEQIVTTFDGTKAKRKECRLIKKAYYIMNKQCFKIDGQWHRINNGRVAFDHEAKKWDKKGDHLVFGVVGREKDEIKTGYFTPIPGKNVEIIYGNNASKRRCLSEEAAEEAGAEECLADGSYYVLTDEIFPGDRITKEQFLNRKKTQQRNFYGFPVTYSSGVVAPQMIPVYNADFVPLNQSGGKYYRQLTGYSWGVEFETNRGTIPERKLAKNGLIPCRDGSITGFEYVTIPLQGRKGLQAIYNQCNLLQRYCEIDEMCSMHTHIGGFPIEKKQIMALYRVLTSIQDEIYSMFPYAYQDTSQFKRRDYCSRLKPISMPRDKNIDTAFQRLYEYLSGGEIFHHFGQEHPMDRSGEHKWNVSPRYKWVNLIPLMFGTRGTVEFRVHTPTFNPDKVINWIFICAGILEFAKRNYKKLFNTTTVASISLKGILTEVYIHEVARSLCDYIYDRQFMYQKRQDPTGSKEIAEDLNYVNPTIK